MATLMTSGSPQQHREQGATMELAEVHTTPGNELLRAP
jgi:hypothetical protein